MCPLWYLVAGLLDEVKTESIGCYEVGVASLSLNKLFEESSLVSLFVGVKFTNNGDKAVSLLDVIDCKVFQAGNELEPSFTMMDDFETENVSSLMVEPGKTGITYMSYFIKSETEPVSIGFAEAGSGDSFMYAPQYEITNLPYVEL